MLPRCLVWDKCLANTKRPCHCSVLCLRPRRSLFSWAQSISDMTSFSSPDQGRDIVCPVLWKSTWKNLKKRGWTAGVTMTLLRIPTRVSASADRPTSYGNQTISSTQPSCWIQISTVDVINIAADHQGRVAMQDRSQPVLSSASVIGWETRPVWFWRPVLDLQRDPDVYNTHRQTKLTAPETISRWLMLKKCKIALWATLSGLRGNVHTPSIARWKAHGRLSICHHWPFSLSLMVETLWAEICRSRRFLKVGGSLSANIWLGRWHRPPTTVGIRRLEWLPFRVVSKYPQFII